MLAAGYRNGANCRFLVVRSLAGSISWKEMGASTRVLYLPSLAAFLAFAHLFFAALVAISLRRLALNSSARARPPFFPMSEKYLLNTGISFVMHAAYA